MAKRRPRSGALGTLTRVAALSLLAAASVLAVCSVTAYAQGPVPPLPNVQDAIQKAEEAVRAGAAAAGSIQGQVREQIEAAKAAPASAPAKVPQTAPIVPPEVHNLALPAHGAQNGAPAISLPTPLPPAPTGPSYDGHLDTDDVAGEGGWIRGYRLPPLSAAEQETYRQELNGLWSFPESGPDVYSNTALVNRIWQQMKGRWHDGRFETAEDAVNYHIHWLHQVISDLFDCSR